MIHHQLGIEVTMTIGFRLLQRPLGIEILTVEPCILTSAGSFVVCSYSAIR